MSIDPKATRGYRNRNPGNIEHVPANKWQGLGDAFGTSAIQAGDVLTVAIAVLSSVEADDTFTLGADTLTVQHAERDAAGIAWRVFCRR
jgi:hypothetical protein